MRTTSRVFDVGRDGMLHRQPVVSPYAVYGGTKPGPLLKHHIYFKTDRWDVQVPGFTEKDLVTHSGERADGEFAYTLNLTDIQTTWVESGAVLGKGEVRVCTQLDTLRRQLPLTLAGIDSDNGTEFINAHLVRCCETHHIQFTRGRHWARPKRQRRWYSGSDAPNDTGSEDVRPRVGERWGLGGLPPRIDVALRQVRAETSRQGLDGRDHLLPTDEGREDTSAG